MYEHFLKSHLHCSPRDLITCVYWLNEHLVVWFTMDNPLVAVIEPKQPQTTPSSSAG